MTKGFGSPVLPPQQQREAKLLRQSVLQHFQHLPDPRTGRRKDHNLVAMITIGMLAVLCGADGFVAIETYGKANQAWLETFLDLPCGIPSHDTFGRVFGMLEPQELQASFLAWVSSITEKLGISLIHIDGKTAKGSYSGSCLSKPQFDRVSESHKIRKKLLMPAPLSIDLRQRIIAAYEAKEGSQRQLAERFKVSLSFIRDLMRRYRELGTVHPKPHGGGAVAKIGNERLPIVEAFVTAQPDALLKELCERFAGQTGIEVSVSTMQQAVCKLKLSVKKKH
jgi:transposase